MSSGPTRCRELNGWSKGSPVAEGQVATERVVWGVPEDQVRYLDPIREGSVGTFYVFAILHLHLGHSWAEAGTCEFQGAGFKLLIFKVPWSLLRKALCLPVS